MTTSPPSVHLHIGSDLRSSGSGGTHGHVNPATGRVDAEVPLAGASEIDEAVRCAHDAFDVWRRTKPSERSSLLIRLAELIEEHADDFGVLGVLDNGTPISTPSAVGAAAWARYYASHTELTASAVTGSLMVNGEFSYNLAQPYGVIGMIITWNAPLSSLLMKIPAAVAVGNTVVVKPSEMTPFSAELFAELVQQAGFPAGVINIVPGDAAAGSALVEHPLVRKVSFTGGPVTASKILLSCATTFKPVVLELGGKSANIVLEDADLDSACLFSAYMGVGALSGQGCALPTRMLVQESIYDDVVERVSAVAKALVVGDPWDPRTQSGPVISEESLHRIIGMIDRARADGARLVAGGSRKLGDLAEGFYLEPTVLADVDPASELAQDEVFGPVLAISSFKTDADAVAMANGTKYGLSGYVQSRDLRRALAIAEELDSGQVMINGSHPGNPAHPFGGTGASGFGKEGGAIGAEEFVRIKSIATL